MSERWIFNASPVILFARIDALDIISKLANAVVPDAVIDEVRAGEPEDPSAHFGLAFAEKRRVSNLAIPPSIAHWDLGSGESQVISHAIQSSAWAVLDDLAGRRCAKVHQIPVIGSLGIVLRAKRKGLIGTAAPWIRKLKAAGMYIDDHLVRTVLATLGEASEKP